MEWAVDGDKVALCQHILELVDSSAANLLLNLWGQSLVIVVEELFAVEWLQSAEHTLTNTANGHGTNDLALKVVLVLGDFSNVPISTSNLLVCWNKVSDEDKGGHDDVLSDRDNVGSSDLGDGDTTVGLVGGIEVDVVRTNTGGDGNLELLGLGQTLSSQVSRVETGVC